MSTRFYQPSKLRTGCLWNYPWSFISSERVAAFPVCLLGWFFSSPSNARCVTAACYTATGLPTDTCSHWAHACKVLLRHRWLCAVSVHVGILLCRKIFCRQTAQPQLTATFWAAASPSGPKPGRLKHRQSWHWFLYTWPILAMRLTLRRSTCLSQPAAVNSHSCVSRTQGIEVIRTCPM